MCIEMVFLFPNLLLVRNELTFVTELGVSAELTPAVDVRNKRVKNSQKLANVMRTQNKYQADRAGE